MSCCSDVMKPIEPESCCTPQDTAEHAAKAMKRSGCGCAPVVEDRESGKLVGVVTERDICHHLAAEDVRASDISVEKIMSPASSGCGADDSLEETERKLHEQKATSLPVVNTGGACCGTVSLHNIREITGRT
jgi:CBS domain-containing protein